MEACSLHMQVEMINLALHGDNCTILIRGVMVQLASYHCSNRAARRCNIGAFTILPNAADTNHRNYVADATNPVKTSVIRAYTNIQSCMKEAERYMIRPRRRANSQLSHTQIGNQDITEIFYHYTG